MASTALFQSLSGCGTQIPLMLVCIVALVMIVGRWNDFPKAAMWATCGFGIELLVCVVAPIVQVVVGRFVMGAVGYGNVSWIYMGLAVVWGLLRGVGYGCLLAAVLAERGKGAAG